MIALLSGKLVETSAEGCIINVSGVGYRAHISATTAAALPVPGNDVTLHIHTHVREDAILLYGFLDVRERTLFRQLLSVSGVGPKLAIAILSGMIPTDLAAAIGREDVGRLILIPGIGRKTAERIVVELKDRMIREPIGPARRGPLGQRESLLSALTNLGYAPVTAEHALKKVDGFETMELAQAIRLALKELARA